ncbi:MAG: hypothetical protein V2A79_20420 [Planctomycetota bacterium]
MNPLWFILALALLVVVWTLALLRNGRRTRTCDGSGDPDRGLIVFVEAVRWLFIVWGFAAVCRGFRRGGCGHLIRLFRWSGRGGALLVLPDFLRRRRLLAKADRLARFLDGLAAQYPGRPIHLIGYSTGCYLVLEALKRRVWSDPLDPPPIGQVILLAGAVSPDYPLHSLAAGARGVHTFHSPLDFMISGLAPLLLGTNDGRRSLGCGMIGFHGAPGSVEQRAWSPRAMRLGYFGDHFSITAPAFVARQIAPILAAP